MILEKTLRGTIYNLSLEANMALFRTGRFFQAGLRTAYGRLDKGLNRDDIVPGLCDRFRMDVRFARDAILEAEANRTAMRELIPAYLANTEAKISKVESRLKDYRSGRHKPKRVTLEVALAGLEHRLTKLCAKRDKWQAHLDTGTLPPAIFGSAARFHARRKGQLSHRAWRMKRQRQFWNRGEKDKGGNPHITITPQEDGFTIKIATLPMIKGRLTYFTADLWLPEKKRDVLHAGLADSYAVRIIRVGREWQAHITIREKVEGELVRRASIEAIVGGLDCNTDRLTLGVASPQGNLLARHTIWMRDLRDMRANKAAVVIGRALTKALKWLDKQGATCLVVEKLKFLQDHDTHHRSNRATTKFRSTMVKLVMRMALRRGMQVVQINPAYTSVIGRHKYAVLHRMSTHEAAAYVIARRGQGRDERLPGDIIARLPQLRERLLAEAKLKPAKDKVRAKYLRWAQKLADWKSLSSWSLWSIWDKASGLIA
ncbi:MAG: hypothetical protein KJ077_01070 [Anaerolineae bacterium]|nr:hypothetical protein [Anaerolineae bacterium]